MELREREERPKSSKSTGVPRVEANFLLGGQHMAILFMDLGNKSTFDVYESLEELYDAINTSPHPSLSAPSILSQAEHGTWKMLSLRTELEQNCSHRTRLLA